MKFQSLFALILVAALVLSFFYYDHKVSRLEQQLAEATGKVDTVQIAVQVHDTVFVNQADTVIQNSDTTFVGDTIIVNHYPYLTNTTTQPLFTLQVAVDTRKESFAYDFKYKPLNIYLEFADKYDLRKGFKAYTDPDVGTISTSWNGYTPMKKKFGLSLSGGLFIVGNNPGLMCGVAWKKNELGVMWIEDRKSVV